MEIVIGKSVGNIALGMTRSETRDVLGKYREFQNSSVDMNSFDQFSICSLGYDENNKVEFTSMNSLDETTLTLNGATVTEMTPLQLFSFIKQLDPEVNLETGGTSLESNTLGFAVSFEKEPALILSTEKEIICERLETVTVAVKNYWLKYAIQQ